MNGVIRYFLPRLHESLSCLWCYQFQLISHLQLLLDFNLLLMVIGVFHLSTNMGEPYYMSSLLYDEEEVLNQYSSGLPNKD